MPLFIIQQNQIFFTEIRELLIATTPVSDSLFWWEGINRRSHLEFPTYGQYENMTRVERIFLIKNKNFILTMYIIMNILQKYDSAANVVVIVRLTADDHLVSIKPLTCDFMYLSIRSARALISDFGSYIIPTLGSSMESTTICKNIYDHKQSKLYHKMTMDSIPK